MGKYTYFKLVELYNISICHGSLSQLNTFIINIREYHLQESNKYGNIISTSITRYFYSDHPCRYVYINRGYVKFSVRSEYISLSEHQKVYFTSGAALTNMYTFGQCIRGLKPRFFGILSYDFKYY
jgi:hypothetical protein